MTLFLGTAAVSDTQRSFDLRKSAKEIQETGTKAVKQTVNKAKEVINPKSENTKDEIKKKSETDKIGSKAKKADAEKQNEEEKVSQDSGESQSPQETRILRQDCISADGTWKSGGCEMPGGKSTKPVQEPRTTNTLPEENRETPQTPEKIRLAGPKTCSGGVSGGEIIIGAGNRLYECNGETGLFIDRTKDGYTFDDVTITGDITANDATARIINEKALLEGPVQDKTQNPLNESSNEIYKCSEIGGTWNGSLCVRPSTKEQTPVVERVERKECLIGEGSWVNNACQFATVFTAPPEVNSPTEPSINPNSQVQKNVLVIKECFLEGRTWNGTICISQGDKEVVPPETVTAPATPSELQASLFERKDCLIQGRRWIDNKCQTPTVTLPTTTIAQNPETQKVQEKRPNGEFCPSLNSSSNICENGYCNNFKCTSPPAEVASGSEQNGYVYYSQKDSAWAELPLPGTGDSPREFWRSGCGETVAAALISTYVEPGIDPYELAILQYENLTLGDGTSWQENMDVLEKYGFQSEQYRGSLYNLGNYITNNVNPENNTSAWINASFSSGSEGTRHHSLITKAEVDASGQVVSLTLNDPYFGPDIACEVSSTTTFSCTGSDGETLTVENIGVILVDPPKQI